MLKTHNFGLVTVSTGYDAAATSIVLTTGHGDRLPSKGPFRGPWWNSTDYRNPTDDPKREIIEVTARSTDTLTVVRGKETAFGGLAASTKNDAGKTYSFALAETAESIMRGRADPDREVLFFDDFLNRPQQLQSTEIWGGMIDNNHATFNWRRDDSVPSGLAARRSGVMKIISDSGNSRAGFFQLFGSFGTWGPFHSGGEMSYETELFPPNEALGDDTNNYTLRIGLGLANDSYLNDGNGIWFTYNYNSNSGNWRAVTRNAGVSTNVDSSVAVVAGTLARLKWVRNAAANSVEFFINGASIGVATTNVFGDAVSCGLFMHIDRHAGTARRCLWLDWVRFHQKFDAR